MIRPALVGALLAGAGPAALADDTASGGADFSNLGAPVDAAGELDTVRAFGDDDEGPLVDPGVSLLKDLDMALDLSSGGIANLATDPALDVATGTDVLGLVIPRLTTRSRSF